MCVYKPQTVLKSAFPLEVLMWGPVRRRACPSNPQYTAILSSAHPKPWARHTPEFLQPGRKQPKERAIDHKCVCPDLQASLYSPSWWSDFNQEACFQESFVSDFATSSCTYNHKTTNNGFFPPHLLSSDIFSEKQEHFFNNYSWGPEKCYLFRPILYLIRPWELSHCLVIRGTATQIKWYTGDFFNRVERALSGW